MAPRIRLGDLLVRAGVLDEFKLRAALAEQQRWGGRLGKILVDMNFVSEDILVKALSKQLGLPVVRINELDVPADVVEKLDENHLMHNRVCPVRVIRERRGLLLAMADPLDVEVVDEIAHRTGLRVEAQLAGERAIVSAIGRLFGAESPSTGDVDPEQVFLNNQGGVITPSRPPSTPLELPDDDDFVEPLPLAALLDHPPLRAASSAAPSVSLAPASVAPGAAIAVEAFEARHEKQIKAIRAMVDLLIDKGVFSRDEYLARLNRR